MSSNQEYQERGVLFVSFVLEMNDKDSFVESLVDVAIQRVLFDPLPLKCNRMNLILTTNSFMPKE